MSAPRLLIALPMYVAGFVLGRRCAALRAFKAGVHEGHGDGYAQALHDAAEDDSVRWQTIEQERVAQWQ